MTVFQCIVMGLASLMLSLLVMTHPSEQQYAWRPQGRFGKRATYLGNQNSVLSEGMRDLEGLSGRIKMLDTAMFEEDGVLCVSAGSRGLYKCFTGNPESGSSSPLELLNSPFVEVDGILCVSIGDRGTYRCFEMEEGDVPEQSLTGH